MSELTIKIYSDHLKQAVIALILGIQQNEFQVDIDLAGQPDLQDIRHFYQDYGGNFWVAQLQDKVVGCIALLNIGNGQLALRKMFVDKDFRGKEFRVGQQLLDTAINYGRMEGYKEIYLGTTEKFLAAQRFYEKNNFIVVDQNKLPPNFPIMRVDVKFYQFTL